MNRIYQVVWSKAKNCYTVVSEIAKRHGKGNRARTCAAAFLAALALTSVMGMSEAQAQTIDADGISNGDARIALNGAAGMVGMVNGKDASIFMYGGNTTINKKVTIDQTGKIIGVAAGAVTAGSTDAVNGGQLHAVAAEASKHSKVVNGSNINVEESEVNGQKIYKVGLNDDVRLGTIETTGSITTKDSISAANGAQLADINVSGNIISNGKAAIALYGDSGIAGMKNGKGASIYMQDGHTSINEKVNIDKEGNITGANAIQTNALNAKYNLSVGTANENGTMPFFVNSNGAFYAANGKLVVDQDGKVTATAGEIGGVTINKGISYKNTSLRDGSLFVGDDKGNYSQISPEYAKLGNTTANTLNAKYNLSVGKMAETGTMPFFVNSNGAFYAANGKLVVDKDGKVTATAGEIGGVTINKGIFYKNTSLRDGSLYLGDDKGNYSQISPEYAKLGKVTINKEGNITGANAIQTNALNAKYNLSVGTANENGTMPFFVNSTGDFYAANNKFSVGKDGKVTATTGEIGGVTINKGIFYKNTALRDGELFVGDASGNYSQITTKGAKLGKVTVAEDGKITGVAAGAVTAGSTDAVNGGQLHAVAADVAQNKADIAQNKADIAQNKADIAQNKADIAQNKADIAQNKADIGKLDNRVTNVENLAKQHTTVEAGNNITVTESTNTDGGKKYTVGMAKDITVDSVKVGDKTYVSKDGLNANNQTITNVKDGKIEEGSKDAVNGGQLYATNQLVKDNASNISLLGNSINKLDNRVDKVGAGAAALAALHPLDFDPEDKWDFAAGYGNYSGASAVALGAYYRPNEDTMFSVGGSFGNGENMVNAGVSLKLGQSSHAPASKAAMEKKISALSQEVEELKAAIADLRAAQTKAKDATAKDAQKK